MKYGTHISMIKSTIYKFENLRYKTMIFTIKSRNLEMQKDDHL